MHQTRGIMRWATRTGQSTAEYAIVIGVVALAITAMQLYLKRGMQAKVKNAVDHYTTQGTGDLAGTQLQQYEPYYAESNLTVGQNSQTSNQTAVGGKVQRSTNESTQRTGTTTQGVSQGSDTAWR